ncbi:hypothetical protein [Blastomonas sp. CACIA14H2]|uniref:hypothetical protein n=1 Tax=Blastomonas sp. CACIA14H2 TaxID=1419876 RepID=UPI0026870E86
MRNVRLGGVGPDGFEAGQAVEYLRQDDDGSESWVAATIQWYSANFLTGSGNWVIRLHDAPSSSDMQSVPFHSERLRAADV